MAKETGGSFESLSSSIKSKQFVPLYCFCGEEDYFIDELTALIEQYVLNDMEKAFNQTILYGKDSNARQIVEAAMRPPMMAEKQLVIVKEAQGLELRKEEDQTLLLNYFKKPSPSTVLLFAFKHGTPDKRKSLWKELAKSTGFFESKPLYENQIGAFVKRSIAEKKFKIEDAAVELLVESTGTELSKVINEISKLIISKQVGATITVQDIEREVGISREFSAFELNNAFGKKDVTKIYRIAHIMSDSKSNPFVVTVATLFTFFSKIYLAHANAQSDDKTLAALLKVSPFFVKDYREAVKNYSLPQTKHILHLLAEYDLRGKGVNGTGNITEGELLKELVYRILHEQPQDALQIV
jgi:DNA polymerase-3 subunit delta